MQTKWITLEHRMKIDTILMMLLMLIDDDVQLDRWHSSSTP